MKENMSDIPITLCAPAVRDIKGVICCNQTGGLLFYLNYATTQPLPQHNSKGTVSGEQTTPYIAKYLCKCSLRN